MIHTPASGPLSPITCPPMSWAEISILAASAALPSISANALALAAINRFNFMVRSPIVRDSDFSWPRVPRPLWHTVRHVSYFDQSLLVVECSASAMAGFSHGEKGEAAGEVWRLLLADIGGSRESCVRPIRLPRIRASGCAAGCEAMRIFVSDPLGIGGLSFNMRRSSKSKKTNNNTSRKQQGQVAIKSHGPRKQKGGRLGRGNTASRTAATRWMSDASGRV